MNEKKNNHKSTEVLYKNYYNKDQIYTITLNANDKHQFFNAPNRLSKCRKYYYEKLLEAFDSNHVKYDCMIEISEPKGKLLNHSGPRVHVHGIFMFTSTLSIKNYLLYGQRALTYDISVEIDICNDPYKWCQYCKKQQRIIKEDPLQNIDLLSQYATENKKHKSALRSEK